MNRGEPGTERDHGPWGLVDRLTAWAGARPWVDWLELGGSLGRGGGDAWSDVDAGLGLGPGAPDQALTVVRREVEAFRPLAGSRVDDWAGDAHHLSVVYQDGSELSLLVADAGFRDGLPPQAAVLLDRSGRLAEPSPVKRWRPDDETRTAWAHEAWTGIADGARRAHRGATWRALAALTRSRDLTFQLWAASLDLTYPQFGATSVENAGVAAPPGIERTHPRDLGREALLGALDALAHVLLPLTPAAARPVADAVVARVARLGQAPGT